MAVERPILLTPLNVVVVVLELVPPQPATTNSAAVARTAHPIGFLASEINLPLLHTPIDFGKHPFAEARVAQMLTASPATVEHGSGWSA